MSERRPDRDDARPPSSAWPPKRPDEPDPTQPDFMSSVDALSTPPTADRRGRHPVLGAKINGLGLLAVVAIAVTGATFSSAIIPTLVGLSAILAICSAYIAGRGYLAAKRIERISERIVEITRSKDHADDVVDEQFMERVRVLVQRAIDEGSSPKGARSAARDRQRIVRKLLSDIDKAMRERDQPIHLRETREETMRRTRTSD